jgi:hypothetical protein
MIFGDLGSTGRWANDPRIEVHGPGYSKVIIGDDFIDHWDEYLSGYRPGEMRLRKHSPSGSHGRFRSKRKMNEHSSHRSWIRKLLVESLR